MRGPLNLLGMKMITYAVASGNNVFENDEIKVELKLVDGRFHSSALYTPKKRTLFADSVSDFTITSRYSFVILVVPS
jgi:hypothetical protein